MSKDDKRNFLGIKPKKKEKYPQSQKGRILPSTSHKNHMQKPYWLFGVHAVVAALMNPLRQYTRLLVTEVENPALREAKERGAVLRVTPELVPKNRLEELLGRDAVHQGIALCVHPLALLSLDEALAYSGPIIVLDHVTDPRNIGAILRSTAAFGGAFVVVQDRHAPEETAVLAKAASGALEQVPLVRVVNISRALETLKKHDCWTIGLEAEASLLNGVALHTRRVALVLGAEGQGLRRLVREHCDEIAGLYMPQRAGKGKMESLNVSIAAAVGLYEIIRHTAPV